MRKLSMCAWALGASLAVIPGATAPAYAQPSLGPAFGRLCNFGAVADPTVEGESVFTGQLNGGPVTPTTVGSITVLTCAIQVGAANATHTGADAVAATTSASVQAATLAPTLASYAWAPNQPVYLCSSVHVNGVLHYFDSVQRLFSTSAGVPCSQADTGAEAAHVARRTCTFTHAC